MVGTIVISYCLDIKDNTNSQLSARQAKTRTSTVFFSRKSRVESRVVIPGMSPLRAGTRSYFLFTPLDIIVLCQAECKGRKRGCSEQENTLLVLGNLE